MIGCIIGRDLVADGWWADLPIDIFPNVCQRLAVNALAKEYFGPLKQCQPRENDHGLLSSARAPEDS
jgi:hypothetical protein